MKKILLSAVFLAASFTMTAQVGVGTTTPNTSAALDVTSTTKGFLPPRMNVTQMNAIASPAEGLLVYCTNCVPKGIYVSNGTAFATLTGGADQTGAAVGEVRSSTGLIWQEKNLGANIAAASGTDFNGYGDLYQWGRRADGHQTIVRNASFLASGTAVPAGSSNSVVGPVTAGSEGSNFITSPSDWLDATDDTRWQTAAEANNPCSSGYRIPTETELNNERLAFSSNNAAGAFASPLKLPVAGYRHRSVGALNDVGINGFYWSSTVSGANARYLYFYKDDANMGGNTRVLGFSVRCIKN